MEIKPGKFVVLTYDLYAGAGEPEETLMMRATDEMPDQFVFGVDQNILPSMLKRLEGLKQGDKFDFVLSCEEAFGERNEEHVMELDKEIFMVDGKFVFQCLVVGNTVPMLTSEGYRINGSVLKVTDDKVLMDFNHPLAGENLHYVGMVKLVRDATEEELHPRHSCGCGCGHDHGSCGDDCGDCCDGCHYIKTYRHIRARAGAWLRPALIVSY